MMPFRRTFGCAFVADSVQPLCGAGGACREGATVAGELKRLAAEGHDRARDRRRAPRHLRRRAREGRSGSRAPARSSSAASSPTSRTWPRASSSRAVAAARAVPDAAAQRRVVEHAAAAALRRARRLRRLRARVPVLSRPRHPDPVARHVRQAQRLLERRPALRRPRAGAARRGRCRWPPSAPAASPGSTCSRSTARRPPWVSSLAQGTGLQAMARSATRLRRQAEVFPVALRGLGIFQTAPPAGVRIARRRGAHYLQYSGLPRLRILNGFIQSLVGLYDFAALTGDPTAQLAVRVGRPRRAARRCRRSTPAPGRCTRAARSRRESDLGYHKLLRDFLVAALQAHGRRSSTAAPSEHFTAYLTTPPAVRCCRARCAPTESGTLRFKLSKISRVIAARHARDEGRGDRQPGRARPRARRRSAWTAPKRSGDYTVTVTATDLAGNAATRGR